MKYFIALCIATAMLMSCGKKHDHNHDHDHSHDHSGHVHGEGCNHDHDHDHSGHSHAAADEHSHAADAIIFTPEQAAKIDFEVANPAMEPFGQVIKTTAQIQSSQTDETIVSAKASGIVLFSGKNITEGQAVSSGQTLFSVSGSGIENNSAVRFAEAKSTYERAEDAYKRAQELVKETIISEREFQERKSEYEVAKAVYDNLVTNFTGKGQRISSPRGGYIKQLLVSNGQYVEEGQALVRISADKSLILKADVSPKYASVLPNIADAVIIGSDKQSYTLKDLNGKVLSYGRSLNEGNYLLPVSFQVDNKAGFLPGGFVEMYIRMQSSEPVMTLPGSALTEEQGLYFVYVQLCGESYEKRLVDIGATDGIRTQILLGLSADERVVTIGAMSVKLAQASGALDPHAGHVH
jgi:RND family efflux transporter, MFP subunit